MNDRIQHLILVASFLISGNGVLAQKVLLKGEEIAFIAPEISPDGMYVAITSKGYTGLWTIRTDGYNLRQFSSVRGAGYIKRWSPDSKWILYRESNDGKQELKIGETFTRNVSSIRIPVRKFEDVRWIDNDKLYIRSSGNITYLRSGLNVESNKKNQTIVYTDSEKIYLESPGKKSTDIIDPVLGVRYIDPVLSPDGRMLAFEILGGNLQVYELNTFQLHDLGRGGNPGWSPDGKKIVYQITLDDGHSVISSDLYLTNFDGTEKLQLTKTQYVHEMRPSFYPKGNRIIYDTDLLGEIRTMKVPVR
ncbi:MAG: PD40 domain-containing protein [Candidatus Marinimicrobia bacterium]|nr:PD40 domain-containing protein [Candidatus Neomarinimicrobiota bacterium]